MHSSSHGRTPLGPHGTAGDEPSLFSTRRNSETAAQEEDAYYEEAMANAERELAEDAEWKRIQQNTFTRWVNQHLRQVDKMIDDLETDFADGLRLIALIEVLSGKKMPRHNRKPTFRSQKLENVSIALKFLEQEGVTLVNIDSTDIADCKLKLIMGLVWTLILHYSISMPMYDGPELGGPLEEKTPKQRLLGWIQNKLPGLPVTNFTQDWKDGKAVGALVDSVAPGLCPDWEDWSDDDPIRNATEAMDLADDWLGVPKLLTPQEIVNPSVDEQSVMTYLSQFPNAKLKEGAPLRTKATSSKVRAFGPGLEPTGIVAKAPAKFTVETFGAGDGEVKIVVVGPGDKKYDVDCLYNNDRKKTYSCSYTPDVEGQYTINIEYGSRAIPKSPFEVRVEGFAGDANKVTVSGPGIQPEGVVVNKQTYFDIFTEGAGKGRPEVIVLDPKGKKESVPVKMNVHKDNNNNYRCTYMPTNMGLHSVNVFFAGNPVPDSPFGVKVGPASNPGKVWAKGRGLQPHGIREGETVDFKVFSEGAGDGIVGVKVIGPGGTTVPTTHRNTAPRTTEYTYTPQKQGRHIVMVTWAGREIPRSPFEVNIGPKQSTKIKAFGPGLKGGIVNHPALFVVDTCGETGALGFSIEGPSQAEINCNDNGDGSADVNYLPTAEGEYAVHILCDNEDIPGSPYMAEIVPHTAGYDPTKVRCYGPGIEEVVVPGKQTDFTIDATLAGDGPVDVSIMDDYGEMTPETNDKETKLVIKILEAKQLTKTDTIGKSDPYAVIKCGNQNFKTNTINNTQDPKWDFETAISVLDNKINTINIEVFDSDTMGQDTSLGMVNFDASQVLKQKGIRRDWYPLAGMKTGQILLTGQLKGQFNQPDLELLGQHPRPRLNKKGDNIYQCEYTPRKTQKLVVNVNYARVAVPGSPFRVDVDDPTDPGKVKVYGPGVEDGVKVGKPVSFNVDCTQAGPGDLGLDITDDRKQPVKIDVKEIGNGLFEVEYHPIKKGTHMVSIKYDGRELPQSPLRVEVVTGIDTSLVKVKNIPHNVYVNCTNDLTVDTSSLPPATSPQIDCHIVTPNGQLLPNVFASPVDDDGQVMVNYTPTEPGQHDINISCDDEPVEGSPWKVNAIQGSDPRKVRAFGPGLEKGILDEPNEFTITTKNAGQGGLGLAIEGPSEAKMTCKDNRDGSCTVEYVPTVQRDYDINIKFDEINIPGSPFRVPVKDEKPWLMDPKLSEDIPIGNIQVNLIKARHLIKADIIGNSDPYAILTYGGQSFNTDTLKNTQEPEWNCQVDFKVPDGNVHAIKINIFDNDKVGKDKSLGSVEVDIGDIVNNDGLEEQWYTLNGVKSGEVLLGFKANTDGRLGPTEQVDPNRVKAYGPGIETGKVLPGKPTKFTVDSTDTVPAPLTVSIVNNGGQKSPKISEVEPGVHDVTYIPPPVGQHYKVDVKYDDTDIPGSPFEMTSNPTLDDVTQEDITQEYVGNSESGNSVGFGDINKSTQRSPGKNHGSINGANSPVSKLMSNVPNECLGKLKVKLIKAKDLIKTDFVGKADPYAILTHGDQQCKTNIVKNTQTPEWNYDADFYVPDGPSENLTIELFDSDKIGKDKSLGVLNFNIGNVIESGEIPAGWYQLDGVKSGQVLLSADLASMSEEDMGNDVMLRGIANVSSEQYHDVDGGKKSKTDVDGKCKDGGRIGGGAIKENKSDLLRKGKTQDLSSEYPDALARLKVKLIKAKDLIKTDILGKSDPYAILTHGKQQYKTNVINNSQNPEWNYNVAFLVPESETLTIELFDSDKIGKDKSLGLVNFKMDDVIDSGEIPAAWYSLNFVKSGHVLMSADLIPLQDDDDSVDIPMVEQGGRDQKKNVDRLDSAGKSERLQERDNDRTNPDAAGEGQISINLMKAKDLVKTDIIGKPDPYAILSHGSQKYKTDVVENSQHPDWNCNVDFTVPADNESDIHIEVFDSDKFGKDKSLGFVDIGIDNILNNRDLPAGWQPLNGVKTGEILVSAEYSPITPRENSKKVDPLIGRDDKDKMKKVDPLIGRDDKDKMKAQGIMEENNYIGTEPNNAPTGLTGCQDKLNVKLIKAKDLIKPDFGGKADPYAVLTHGNQQCKTNIMKNTQTPEWNYDADFYVPDGQSENLTIELFDSDKIGKDKSLGVVDFNICNVIESGEIPAGWYQLDGVKSGQVLLNANLASLTDGGLPNMMNQYPDTEAQYNNLKDRERNRGNTDKLIENKFKTPVTEFPSQISVNLMKAKDLVKMDIIGKSDPYAVLSHGSQKFKTNVIKNNQNPEWNYTAPFTVDGNDSDIHIEIFDSDKLGKDKSLGSLNIPVEDVFNKGDLQKGWQPLKGVKSGQVLVSTECLKTFSEEPLENESKATQPKNRGLKGTIEPFHGKDGNIIAIQENDNQPDNVNTNNQNKSRKLDTQSIDGNLYVEIIRAKDLTNGDILGKSDPYAVISFGEQSFKTNTVKNTQNPVWDFGTDINVNSANTKQPLSIEVFDEDTLGCDKSLGNATIPLNHLLENDNRSQWIPLDKTKSGEIFVSSNFTPYDENSENGSPDETADSDREMSHPGNGKELVPDDISKPGQIIVNILKAEDLVKKDFLVDSDPYVILSYGDQVAKTEPAQNGRNLEWNQEAKFKVTPAGPKEIHLEIFDDNDKSLGTAKLDTIPMNRKWIHLDGVKSGKILLETDFVPDNGLSSGKIHLNLIKAQDLIKTDLIGKSDPYAIIRHGQQQYKTEVQTNTQHPEFNCQIELDIGDTSDRFISIELLDKDKFGKDKSLGTFTIDVEQLMNEKKLDNSWYPLSGVKSGKLNIAADFVPSVGSTSANYHQLQLDKIPLPSTGGHVDALVKTPSNRLDKPQIEHSSNGTVAINYQPVEEGLHHLDVKYNNDHVQGSPFKFNVTKPEGGSVNAYGPGLTHGVCGEPANFSICTRGAGAGGLSLAVEGPSKADISCHDNKDGTVNVSYQPTAPGEYKITAKFADKNIPGSPFTCKVTGEGKKRNQISVGSSSELSLPGNLSESDLRALKAYIESPSGCTEQCYLKKLPKGNIGISFTPREVGEHLVSVKKNDKHITNSPFKIIVNPQEVGDASRVIVSGEGLSRGKTQIKNKFQINTKSAGYGGLSLSIEGPSKAEIDCKDNEDGTLDVNYIPTEPGFYVINIKFADAHVPGSPFQVPISGEGSEKQTENIKYMREAVPVTEVGSQCRLTFKMPGINIGDLAAVVCSPSGNMRDAHVTELEDGLYAVNFVPYELGIHTVTVRYRDMDIPGSPFQFTVGPLQDGGAHRVHAGGPGLEIGVEGESAEFNVWTREAGPGSLAISVEGPSKAQIDFKDRKDGSCYVSYVVDEPGEYSVGIRFNDQHIPDSPYKVQINPRTDHAEKVRITNLESAPVISNTPQSFLLHKNGADGQLECKMVSPSGREDDCFISQIGPDEYSVRFVPKEGGIHHLHAKLNGVHVPRSPFKINVDTPNKKYGSVGVSGSGIDQVKIGQKASFVIDTSNVGAGTLSVTVDGPSKVDMDCVEVSSGYEVSYTPTVAGEYFVTVKYNGTNVEGSPFKVTVVGGGVVGTRSRLDGRRESSSVTMETVQHTSHAQQENVQHTTVSKETRRQSTQPTFASDASQVKCNGPGIQKPVLGKQNSFVVDCSRAGSNVLFVGVFGPDTPCDEVYVKHQGDKQYGVSYKLKESGQYILYVKFGEEHVPGSPFHVQV